jgi:hypothetical protein
MGDMVKFFGGGKKDPTPIPVPKAPAVPKESDAAQKALDEMNKMKAKQRGQASTIFGDVGRTDNKLKGLLGE